MTHFFASTTLLVAIVFFFGRLRLHCFGSDVVSREIYGAVYRMSCRQASFVATCI
jgi:hypothetical protein